MSPIEAVVTCVGFVAFIAFVVFMPDEKECRVCHRKSLEGYHTPECPHD